MPAALTSDAPCAHVQVSLGVTPDATTLAAAVGACARAGGHELAFRAAAVGRARGVALDSMLVFILARIAYSKIRRLWAPPLGYPVPRTPEEHAERAAAAHQGAGVAPPLAARLLRALAGREVEAPVGDGPAAASQWRDRVHAAYRCAPCVAARPAFEGA